MLTQDHDLGMRIRTLIVESREREFRGNIRRCAGAKTVSANRA